MGLFRKRIEKVPNEMVMPFRTEVITPVEVMEKGMTEPVTYMKHTFIDPELSKASKDMPSKDEYELGAMLKAGYKPEEINVRGMLPVDDLEAEGYASVVLDKLRATEVEKPVDKSDQEHLEDVNNLNK